MWKNIPYIPLQANELPGYNTQSFLCLAGLFLAGLLIAVAVERIFKPQKKWLCRSAVLTVYAGLLAVSIYFISHRLEEQKRVVWAARLANNRDKEGEKRFAAALPSIESYAESNRFDSLQIFLEKTFPDVQFYFTFCAKDERLIIETDTLDCKTWFESRMENATPTACRGLLAVDYGFEHFAYLYRAPVKDTLCLYIDMGRIKIAGSPGEKGYRLPADYSYGFYESNTVSSHSGSYPYPYDLETGPLHQPRFAVRNGYSHLLYPLPGNKTLVLSTPQANPWEILHNFSLLLLLFGTLGALVFISADSGFRGRHATYRQRFRSVTYLLIIFSFAIFSVAGIFFMRGLYRAENQKVLHMQTLSILAEMEKRNWQIPLNEPGLYQAMEHDMQDLSELFRTTVYCYSADGTLLFDGEKSFVPAHLDPNVLQQAEAGTQHIFIQTVSVRKNLSALTAIAPFRNEYGQILGYLYIPYFWQNAVWQNEMSRFLGGYLTLMTLLGLLIFWIAGIMARRLTKPLSVIAEKVAQTDLTGTNTPLVWKRRDEIGALVNQYNLLLKELEESWRKLAETERESAWSEMARQVAHEIKNPLTPMKLQVQQLERAYKDGKEDFGERLMRFTDIMTRQIDRLAAIAQTFSQFAKWQNAECENIEPAEFLQNVYRLYKPDTAAEFVLNLPENGADTRVSADVRFLEQVFHNLIKNALQAGAGRIELGMHTAQDGTCVLYVKNNGPAIDASQVQHIFEPHFTTKTTGAGLGLSICKKLCESMNAQIALSQNGENGEVCFEIRVCSATA